jgi:hypothetical protein
MDTLEVILAPVRALFIQFGNFLPQLLLALAIAGAGWLLAKMARFAAARALRAVNFHVVTEKAGIDAFLQQGGGQFDTTRLMALLVYALVMLLALSIAFNTLGLPYVADLVLRVLLFVTRLIAAVLIVTFGSYFARYFGAAVATYCRNADIGDPETLGRVAMYAILMFVVLLALDQLNIGELLRQTFLIILAAIGLAFALAFGLGGRTQAASFLRRLFPPRPDEPRSKDSSRTRDSLP